MWDLINALGERISPWGIVGCLLVIVTLGQTGFIPWFFGERYKTRLADASREDARVRELIEDLRTEADRQREWRVEDTTQLQAEIAQLRVTIHEKDELIASQIRGDARMRHAISNLMSYVQALRTKMIRENIMPAPFNGWDTLLAYDTETAEKFRDILDEGPI